MPLTLAGLRGAVLVCMVALVPAATAATLAAAPDSTSETATARREPNRPVLVPALAGVSALVSSERTIRLRGAMRELVAARETRAGYEREKFRDWYDADGDCRDTRDEVLAQESRVTVGSICDVTTGRWYSYYDGRIWTSDDDVDIDHFVALAEAWDSGARRWTGGTRDRYANDLGDRRALIAVTDNVNQSKGDQDIAEWLPELNRCRYVREWVAVKLRWQLSVDRTERRRLLTLVNGCANQELTIRSARVRRR
jgi:hypothetical protein